METARKLELVSPEDPPSGVTLLGQAFGTANLSFEAYFRVVLMLVLLAIGVAAFAWRNDAVRTIEVIRSDAKEDSRAARELFREELKAERQLFREQTDLTRRSIEKLDASINRLVESIR